jgi:hypothetical protein
MFVLSPNTASLDKQTFSRFRLRASFHVRMLLNGWVLKFSFFIFHFSEFDTKTRWMNRRLVGSVNHEAAQDRLLTLGISLWAKAPFAAICRIDS